MIGDINAAASAAPASTGANNALGQLGSDAFLKLLVAQLRYQNPMAPNDGQAMLEQTAQFTQVETMQKIAETQSQLIGFQQVTLAASFVGKQVEVTDDIGQQLTGTVESVRFSASGPLLIVDGIAVPLDRATSVSARTPAAPNAPTSGTSAPIA